MGKAFVAKLAKEGARDPEALAAWIGRKKHGAAFGKKPGGAKKETGGGKPAGQDVTGKATTREERRQINRMAAELWHAKGFKRADESTPQEADAKTREDVLKRRAIEKAGKRGVVTGDIPEWQAQQARQQALRGRLGRPAAGELVQPESRAAQQDHADRVAAIREDFRASEAKEARDRVKPASPQEQKDIDRAADGLASRPELFQRLDASLPQEGAAMSRQQVIQRRAVEKARRLIAARRR